MTTASTSISAHGSGMLVAVSGLSELSEDFEAAAEKITRFMRMSINTTARRMRTKSSRLIRDEVAFPARYLDSATSGKLRVSRQATEAQLTAAITGRFDPTSLTRFVRGAKSHGRKNPKLQVSPGSSTVIPNSFIMNLKNGNQGLAIRLKEGETVRGKRRMASLSRRDPSLYLLYGPSVDQVFRSVAEDVSPEAGEFLENEFLRLTERLF